jgi:hypothetical protein
LTTLKDIADRLLAAGHRDEWQQIAEALKTASDDSDDARIRSLHTEVAARLDLARLNLDGIVTRVRDGDDTALEEFRVVATDVLRRSAADTAQVARLNHAVEWLEQGQHHEQALRINDILGAVAESAGSPEIGRELQELCQRRRSRLELFGKSLPGDLPLATGEPLQLSALAGRNVIVVFWSPSEPESVTFLRSVAARRDPATDRPWELVGICLSKNTSVSRTLFGGKVPEWPFVISGDPERDLGAEFGLTGVPHVMMLGSDGKVLATSMPPEMVPEQLNQWSRRAD